MKLLIVESPGKIKKISSFLGKEHVVKASVGHIRDLSPKSMSINISQKNKNDYTFEPEFENMPSKRSTIADLKRLAKNATSVIIATDKDREGEAIGFHSVSALLVKPKPFTKAILKLLFL